MKINQKRIKRFLEFTRSKLASSPYDYLRDLPRYQETTVKLEGQDFRIADPLSFYWSYREIFLDEIYKFKSENPRPVILDCGSSYGTSIIYFKSIYPDARITGVEPAPDIFELLEHNLEVRGYPDVFLHNKAISNSDSPVRFFKEGADGGRTHPLQEPTGEIEVPSIRLDALIEGPVDFLKMDVEGEETEALCSSEKLDDVRLLFIEYHSFRDTEQSLSRLLDKLSQHGFRYYVHTKFCSPRPLTEEKLQLGMDLQLNIFARKSG